MSTQDKLERVLRDIHVLISRSELYDNTGEKIIVEKKKMFEYLNHLNACIYEMMDEYEVTQQSRDKAEREARKKGDAMILKQAGMLKMSMQPLCCIPMMPFSGYSILCRIQQMPFRIF